MQASVKKTLKCGTRKSLLAKTQSSLVARMIEEKNPGVKIELVGIETQGDKIIDVPLRNAVGKEFFVGEIDRALSDGDVDFAVHSLKDLSLDRPDHLVQAAIPKRENPKDIVIFHESVIQKLKEGKTITLGTSSPRRLENIPPFLKQALPQFNQPIQLEFKEIRGNVNTRLSRIHEEDESDRKLDGVILALAGLIRLYQGEESKKELEELFLNTKKMILPLSHSPTAPGQGALSIECRKDDEETFQIIHSIHDSQSKAQVEKERAILSEWGGGCHQRFGATVTTHQAFGDLLYIRGKKPNNEFVNTKTWNEPSQIKGNVFDGNQWKTPHQKSQLTVNLENTQALFIAHHHAYTDEIHDCKLPIWVSGVKSWFELSKKGLWIDGCADTLGFDSIVPELLEPIFKFPQLNKWSILTYKGAELGWKSRYPELQVLCTYELNFDMNSSQTKEAGALLQHSELIYWNSSSQVDRFKEFIPKNATHCCGSGKTLDHLKQLGFEKIFCFPTYEDWKNWIKK